MLSRLARKYGTDKLKHGYISHYAKLFQGIRTTPIVMLEIGFGKGASMGMWREYFPHATIYCLDKDHQKFKFKNASLVVGDQSDSVVLQSLATRKYDLVIDDGSHKPEHQQITLNKLLPQIKPGGLYIIEDLHTRRTTETTRTVEILRRYLKTGCLTSEMFNEDLAELVGDCQLVAENKMAILRRKA